MDYEHELYHYGILGMKWGIRRYQNPDGSLTSAGKKRYNRMSSKFDKELATSKRNDEKMRETFRKRHDKKQNAISKRELEIGLAGRKDYQITDAKLKKLYTKMLKDAVEEGKYKIGSEIYNSYISRYKDMKLKELSDPSIKESQDYKDAIKQYKNQKFIVKNAADEWKLKTLYGEWYLNSLAKSKQN